MELRVGKIFRVGTIIGKGNNSEVYEGTNVHTGEVVALKLEQIKRRAKHLKNEAKVYRLLNEQCKHKKQCIVFGYNFSCETIQVDSRK